MRATLLFCAIVIRGAILQAADKTSTWDGDVKQGVAWILLLLLIWDIADSARRSK